MRASAGPTSTEGARSTFFLAPGRDAPRGVVAGRGEPGRRRRDALVEVAGVEDVVVGDRAVGGDDPGAAARTALLGRDDGVRLHVELEREQGYRPVIGDRDRRAARPDRRGRDPDEGGEVVLDAVLAFERVAQRPDPAHLRRGEDDERDERRDAEPRPRPPMAVAAGQARPAERAGAAEDREDRGGQQQVAAEDRQAGGGEHAEGDHGDDPRRRAEQRARTQPREREEAAAGRAEQDRLPGGLPPGGRGRGGAAPPAGGGPAPPPPG